MDWAAFFKDYGQSLFTLGGVFLGSAIAFFINWLNLKNQSLERDKDRQEARREAKIQLALDLMRNDIKIIEETIESFLKLMEIVKGVVMTVSFDKEQEKIIIKKLMSMLSDTDSQYYKLNEVTAVGGRIAYSLGEEFFSEYKNFRKAYSEFHSLAVSPSEIFSERFLELNEETIILAGKCHSLLREKLVSLRES